MSDWWVGVLVGGFVYVIFNLYVVTYVWSFCFFSVMFMWVFNWEKIICICIGAMQVLVRVTCIITCPILTALIEPLTIFSKNSCEEDGNYYSSFYGGNEIISKVGFVTIVFRTDICQHDWCCCFDNTLCSASSATDSFCTSCHWGYSSQHT